MNHSIINILKENCSNSVALIECGKGITYSELWAKVNLYAKELEKQGIDKGKIIVLSFPNSIELSIIFLALLQLEAIPLIVNELQENAIDFEKLNCYGYLAHEKNTSSALYKSLIERKLKCESIFNISFLFKNGQYNSHKHLEDTALLVTSSGSTSISKVIKLSAAGTIANIKANVKSIGIRPDDTTIMALPMNYSYGLIAQFLSHLYVGSKIVLADARFAITQIPRLIPASKATSLFTVPPMIRQINYMQEKGFFTGDFSSLRFITVGGNHIEKESLQRAMNVFSCPFIKTYGLAEAGPRVSTYKVETPTDPEIDSVGYPLEGVKMRVLDAIGNNAKPNEIGRVLIESPSVMNGYMHELPPHVKPQQSILTEDMAYFSETGKLFVLGRSKNQIVVEGRSIWFQEIANAIYSTGKVLKAIVDVKNGETIISIVTMPACKLTHESVYLLLCEHFQFNAWEKVKIEFLKANSVKVAK
ncbi:class I adenylate-forming enzyme family protein [Chondrinema litorale]|uniref:class I adenylate-forming enzyme family protein n=1 Tax=Chondrinema litorale TaxID=2994555 RepID=UPI002542D2C9|nr:class I adenylate-forming enzyme family protein [Chondrinema litorale]UZR96682.1 class I adenylate-forming enzyme family protein [Chondrinema litorale]